MSIFGSRLFNDPKFFTRRLRNVHQRAPNFAFAMIQQDQDVSIYDIHDRLLADCLLTDLVIGSEVELRIAMQPELFRDAGTGRIVTRFYHDAVVSYHGSKSLWKQAWGKRDMPRYGYIGTNTARLRSWYDEPSAGSFQASVTAQLAIARQVLKELPSYTQPFNVKVKHEVREALQMCSLDMRDWRNDLRPRLCTCDKANCLEHQR